MVLPRGDQMRSVISLLLAGTVLTASTAAHAAEELKFAKAPAWVAPQTIPAAADKAKDRPIALLLHDQQVLLEPGKISTYSELAFKIQKPEGLAAGNLSVAWNPAFDTATVNRLEIRRGNQVIDVLKSGQTFTTMRRESNLELAMLDGMLTANIQPEGLQEGDVIVLATMIEHVDPTLKGHVEATFAPWGGAQIGLAHARLAWSSNVDLKLQKAGDLPVPQQSARDGKKIYELTMHDIDPVIDPKGAPVRFKIGRMGEATDFRSWADAGRLMAPLYRTAAVVPASGPLRDEVEKIRKASADPKVRAEQALQLVQQRVRYVALLMGQGGYVPAPAETTWSRRFGDCKAKTTLLLAILHELGINAEPVAANPILGDAIGESLPMIGLFNHVLVRAHVAGKDYWLDGTRTGDTSFDSIEVPDFGWGLPLVENAQLVHMVPAPRDVPSAERRVSVDASDGIFAPAKTEIEEIYRGDSAVQMNSLYSSLSSDQRDEQLHDKSKGYFDTFAVTSSSVQFDKTKRELDIKIQGKAQLSWKDGWFFVPTSSVGFDPDFDRPAGPFHDVPVEVSHPRFAKDIATIKLPAGLVSQQKLSPAVHQTLAGVEYVRTEKVTGDLLTVESSERSIVPEVSYKDALAAEQQLRAMSKDDVYLKIPEKYLATDGDLVALNGQTPQSPLDHLIRAQARVAHGQTDNALDDLNAALALEPKNLAALMMRATIYVQQHKPLEAEKDIAAGLSIEPNNANLLAFRGAFLMTQAKNDAAKQSFIRALEVDPNNVQARLQLGWLFSSQNDPDGAMREFNTLITRDPRNVQALAARALVNALKQDYEAAKKDIAAAEAIDPNDTAVKTTKATIAGQQNDYASEIEIFSGLIAQNPKSGGNYFNRAGAYSALGKDDLALKDVDEAITLGFKDTPVRVLRANIMMRRGNREAVAHEADLMLQEVANSSWALVAAAKTYAAIGQRDKAMQAFDRALAIKPEAYIYVNRAQVRPSSDVSGRLADLDQALKLEANMPDALSIKASILSNQGKYSEALALYDQMPKSGVNGTWLETQRAVLLSKSGRSSEAVNAFASLRSKAKSPGDLNSLCWAEGTAGVALDDAVGECSEAVKLSDRNPQYVDSLGMALLKSGKLDEALTVYTEAINKGHLSASYMGRAIIYARKGDQARAQADFAEAKKLEPTIDDRFAEYGLKFDWKVAPAPDSDGRVVTKH
jgi:tetratricopeptide (TPR) repeat protein